VPKPEWGTKRTCLSCGAKFYDMMRSPIVCPKCETVFVVESKPRRARAAPVEKPVPKPKPVVDETEELEVEDVEEVEDDEDADDALLPDDEDEEDDLDDVGIGATPGEDDEET
jgi:uncharacterized protein (TIGR02300 family)